MGREIAAEKAIQAAIAAKRSRQKDDAKDRKDNAEKERASARSLASPKDEAKEEKVVKAARTRSLSNERPKSPTRRNSDDVRAASKRSTSRVREAPLDKDKKERSKRPVNALAPRDDVEERKSRKVDKVTDTPKRSLSKS